jgi:hypothetical protein
MTTDEAIVRIKHVIEEEHSPGSHANAIRLAEFLEEQAELIREQVIDDMSARND